MFEIAVYLLDEKYRREILSSLILPQYLVHLSSDIKEVLSFCETDLIDVILVWPAKKQLVSNLLDLLRKHQQDYLPVIPVVRNHEDFHAVSTLAIANVIQIPLPRKEFFSILNTVLDAKHAGDMAASPFPPLEESIEKTSLLEALDISHNNENNALISINAAGHIGRVYIRKGQIVRANFRALEGMDALRKLVILQNIDLTIHYTEVDEEDLLGIETGEILSELTSYSQELHTLMKKLDSGGETYRTSENIDPDSYRKDKMKRTILSLCRDSETIFNTFAVMNQENLQILKSMQELLDKGALISSAAGLPLIQEKKKKNSLKTLFRRLERFWQKEKQKEEELPPEKASSQDTEDLSEFMPEIAGKNVRIGKLDQSTINKIQNFLAEL